MRKWLIVLMAAVAIGATGILGWLYMRQDRKGPDESAQTLPARCIFG